MKTVTVSACYFLSCVMVIANFGFSINVKAQQGVHTKTIAEQSLPLLSRSRLISDGKTEGRVDVQENVPRWTWTYKHPVKVNFIRLHMRGAGFSTDNSWYLQVKDRNGQVVDTIRRTSFWGEAPNAEVWTKLIWDSEVTVELYSAGNPINLQIEIDRLNYSSNPLAPRSITTGRNDMRDLVKAYGKDHTYYAYGQPTAIIFFVAAHDKSESSCTGFLLTPELFITNNHCIKENWQIPSTEIHFGYETNSTQKEIVTISKIEVSSKALDFSLLRLSRPLNNRSVVKIDTNPVRVPQQLVLIGYPNANFKTISVIDCVIQKAIADDQPNGENDFYHLCDTQGGNSGSPVINNDNGRVVGIHHLGIPGVNDRGINLAVKITSVLNHIRSSNESLYNQIIQNAQ
jgi:V8-like Glu-specific endopeptidase